MGGCLERAYDRPVYLLFPVAVDIYPEGRDAVKVAPAVRVYEVVALALLDYERVSSFPLLHLGERVPYMGLVELLELLCPVSHLFGSDLSCRGDDKFVACLYAPLSTGEPLAVEPPGFGQLLP